MQVKPMGWPAAGPVEMLPEVLLVSPGAVWPPATAGRAAGTSEVGSWSVSKQITGGHLPGQVRSVSGFSIASGSVTIPQPTGEALSPWASYARRIGPGGACTLLATYAGPSRGLSLGHFVIAPISGANTSNVVGLDLDENAVKLRRPYRKVWDYDPNNVFVDASVMLAEIAAWAGYERTSIEDSGSIIAGPIDVGAGDAWSLAQDIAASTFGAVWISEDGVFTYRNRDSLRGVGRPVVEEVEALDSLESLAWRVDPGEVCDRVEVTYQPTVVRQEPVASITVWEATESIRVRAQQTVTMYADITGVVSSIDGFLPLWSEAAPVGVRSRWAAATSQSGGGDRPPNNAIRVGLTMVSPTRIRVNITNTTNDHLWLVDGNGDPCLVFRTRVHIAPGEPATLALGASEESAVNPLSVDLGGWVQEHDTATMLMAWLYGQVSQPQATIEQVRVVPDLARQIGDIIRLTEAESGLRSKALISGIHLEGDSAGYSQHLDLVILDPTFADWDNWMRSNGIDTFADLDAWMASQSIDTFAQFDEWGRDLGGTI